MAENSGRELRSLAEGDVTEGEECLRRLEDAGAYFCELIKSDRFDGSRFASLRSRVAKTAARPLWDKPMVKVLDAAIRWIQERYPEAYSFLDRQYGGNARWDLEYLKVNIPELARFVGKELNSPSETASFLAVCVGSLDSLARRRFTTAEALYAKSVEHTVKEFLAAYQAACVNVVPVLPSIRRDDPVRHAGVSGLSYHEIAFRTALKQFETIYIRLDPNSCLALENYKWPELERYRGTEFSVGQVLEDWPMIADDLAELFADQEPIDSRFLSAGIDADIAYEIRTNGSKKSDKKSDKEKKPEAPKREPSTEIPTNGDTVEESLDLRALALFLVNRNLTKKQMADRLGCNAKSLTPKRCPQLDVAIKAHRTADLPKGSKSSDGSMEAWE